MVTRKLASATCIILALAITLALIGCGGGTEEPSVKLEKVSEFEGGRLYRAGKIYVAQLNGDFREMGRQYGGLMKTQIGKFYDEAVDGFFSSHPDFPRKQVEALIADGYEVYPARIQQVFEGMEETGGLSVKELVVIDNAYLLPMLAGDMGGCSMTAAWDEYTGDGPLVYGRSFDWAKSFQDYNDTLTVVVFNPDDGSRSTATIANAGQVGSMQSFNDAKLVLSMNAGTFSGGQDVMEDGEATVVNNVLFSLDSSDLKAMIASLKSTRPSLALIFDVANTRRACSLEETTTDYRQRDGEPDGLLIATNHFQDPTWNLPGTEQAAAQATDFWQNTAGRCEGLQKLCDQKKGKIDAKAMMEIFDVPLDQGGPVQPDSTIYEFVTVPAELDLWVKAYGYQDWVRVELGELFN